MRSALLTLYGIERPLIMVWFKNRRRIVGRTSASSNKRKQQRHADGDSSDDLPSPRLSTPADNNSPTLPLGAAALAARSVAGSRNSVAEGLTSGWPKFNGAMPGSESHSRSARSMLFSTPDGPLSLFGGPTSDTKWSHQGGSLTMNEGNVGGLPGLANFPIDPAWLNMNLKSEPLESVVNSYSVAGLRNPQDGSLGGVGPSGRSLLSMGTSSGMLGGQLGRGNGGGMGLPGGLGGSSAGGVMPGAQIRLGLDGGSASAAGMGAMGMASMQSCDRGQLGFGGGLGSAGLGAGGLGGGLGGGRMGGSMALGNLSSLGMQNFRGLDLNLNHRIKAEPGTGSDDVLAASSGMGLQSAFTPGPGIPPPGLQWPSSSSMSTRQHQTLGLMRGGMLGTGGLGTARIGPLTLDSAGLGQGGLGAGSLGSGGLGMASLTAGDHGRGGMGANGVQPSSLGTVGMRTLGGLGDASLDSLIGANPGWFTGRQAVLSGVDALGNGSGTADFAFPSQASGLTPRMHSGVTHQTADAAGRAMSPARLLQLDSGGQSSMPASVAAQQSSMRPASNVASLRAMPPGMAAEAEPGVKRMLALASGQVHLDAAGGSVAPTSMNISADQLNLDSGCLSALLDQMDELSDKLCQMDLSKLLDSNASARMLDAVGAVPSVKMKSESQLLTLTDPGDAGDAPGQLPAEVERSAEPAALSVQRSLQPTSPARAAAQQLAPPAVLQPPAVDRTASGPASGRNVVSWPPLDDEENHTVLPLSHVTAGGSTDESWWQLCSQSATTQELGRDAVGLVSYFPG